MACRLFDAKPLPEPIYNADWVLIRAKLGKTVVGVFCGLTLNKKHDNIAFQSFRYPLIRDGGSTHGHEFYACFSSNFVVSQMAFGIFTFRQPVDINRISSDLALDIYTSYDLGLIIIIFHSLYYFSPYLNGTKIKPFS